VGEAVEEAPFWTDVVGLTFEEGAFHEVYFSRGVAEVDCPAGDGVAGAALG
jgi:hypothetical protein